MNVDAGCPSVLWTENSLFHLVKRLGGFEKHFGKLLCEAFGGQLIEIFRRNLCLPSAQQKFEFKQVCGIYVKAEQGVCRLGMGMA